MVGNNLGLNEMMNPKNEKLAEVINNLPAPIRSVLREFETSTDKVMALYAVTGLTSALVPHVWVNYADTKNYLPVMVLISFPPGSGKGKLALLVKLVRGIVKEQLEGNSLLRLKYIQQKHLYD